MKYFVELGLRSDGIDRGRIYPVYWIPTVEEWRVVFPSESRKVGCLVEWEDETGYAFSPEVIQ